MERGEGRRARGLRALVSMVTRQPLSSWVFASLRPGTPHLLSKPPCGQDAPTPVPGD